MTMIASCVMLAKVLVEEPGILVAIPVKERTIPEEVQQAQVQEAKEAKDVRTCTATVQV